MKSPLLRPNKELKQMYDRHVHTVYHICFMYMKNGYDAEDMVQETFIRLFKDSTIFESPEHEKSWLIRTATNVCKDYFKSWWNRAVHLKNKITHLRSTSIQIDETLREVMKLPPIYRMTIYMHYYEGYSTVEIANILNKNPSTVRGYLHRARKRLKIEIEKGRKDPFSANLRGDFK